ncbi:MAG: primosomal protein N', partial [Myxococcota bacterium]
MANNGARPLVDVCVLSGGVPRPLTYIGPTGAAPAVGCRVRVPLRGRLVVGVVWAHRERWQETDIRLRTLVEVVDENPVVTPRQLQLCRFVARYYHANLGAVLKLCLPPLLGKQAGPRQQRWLWPLATGESLPTRAAALRRLDAFIRTHLPPVSDVYVQRAFPGCRQQIDRLAALGRITLRAEPLPPDLTQLRLSDEPSRESVRLNPDQQRAVQAIQAALESGGGFLLEGVTGSGKTEVYMHVARAMLEQGRSVLVVAPEIALTPLLVTRFTTALRAKVLLLHSGLTQAQRRDTLFTLLQREPRVVVGARSALFAPLPRLGLIVVDEEHDTSHKHEGGVPYHSRDVALWRAKNEKALAVLGSATPSLESCHNVAQGKLTHLRLPQRIGGRGVLPRVEVVDLRARAQHARTRRRDQAQSEGQALCVLSEPLRQALERTLRDGRQAMLFLNRRGYATFALCDACG